MEYKHVLILSYLNTMKSSYSYNEISNLFGLTFKQIETILNKMEEDNTLVLDKYYKLTEMATNILEEYNLENTDFFDTMNEDEELFIFKKMDIEEIYIPTEFLKKVK
jgi:predicted transcriptional regulator